MHVTIDQFWLAFILGTILPAITALVTKRFTDSSTKAIILTALSVITGWLASLQATGGDFDVKAALIGIATTFITAVATHFGLLKPLGVTGSDGAIQRAIPGGIGHKTPVTDPEIPANIRDASYPYTPGAADKP